MKHPSTITIRYVPQKDWYHITIKIPHGKARPRKQFSRNYGSLETLLGFVRDHFGKEGE